MPINPPSVSDGTPVLGGNTVSGETIQQGSGGGIPGQNLERTKVAVGGVEIDDGDATVAQPLAVQDPVNSQILAVLMDIRDLLMSR